MTKKNTSRKSRGKKTAPDPSTKSGGEKTNARDIPLDKSIIIEVLKQFTHDNFLDIYGSTNIKKANHFTNVELTIQSISGAVVKAELTFMDGKYNLEMDFQKELKRGKCSCRQFLQTTKTKHCVHLYAAASTLKGKPELILDFEEPVKNVVVYTDEEIKELQVAAEEKKKHIENLKLDPDTTLEALQEVEDVIVSITLQGLQRMSKSTLEWLNSLIIKTQVAKLANINKEFKKLYELIKQYLEKSVLFDMHDYRYRLNQLINYYVLSRNLIEGLEIKHPDVTPTMIIGKFRSEYVPDSDKIAQCIGMQAWKSQDDQFIGATGYYLDVNKHNLFSINTALPTNYFGKNPEIAYTHISKAITFSLKDLAHGAFKFSSVKLNDGGRLSLHSNLRIYPQPLVILGENEDFKKFRINDWFKLVDVVCNSQKAPIRLPYKLNDYFVLEPEKWGMFEFDPIKQRYTAKLLDKRKNVIYLLVENEEHNQKTIKNLQYIFNKPEMMPHALLGTVFVKDGFISINPITLFWYQGIEMKKIDRYTLVTEFHLNLEDSKALRII
ncbi:MAG: hypothetical protein ACTSUE_09305 [Promethearchaeota archaeon]